MVVYGFALAQVVDEELKPLFVSLLGCGIGEVLEFAVVAAFAEEVVGCREAKGACTYFTPTAVVVVVFTKVDLGSDSERFEHFAVGFI